MNTTLRRRLYATATIFVVMGLAAPALAQTPQSVTGSIDVVSPALNIAKNTDLAFGTVVRPGAGSGTVSIDANSGNVTTSNGITLIGNTATRATFTITGQPSSNIQITFPSTFNLTRTSGTETLSVSLQTTSTGGQIGGGGTLGFSMGGQLVLSSNTVTGAYVGTYTVTAAYN
ncbi:MAG: DUF4402 domain-containing protein [Phenylobacterium sp.]